MIAWEVADCRVRDGCGWERRGMGSYSVGRASGRVHGLPIKHGSAGIRRPPELRPPVR